MSYHVPVLLQEVVYFLDPKPGKRFIDATFGGGGHSWPLLEKGAVVLGIDRDPEALAHAREHFKEYLGARPGSNELRAEDMRNAPGGALTMVQGDFGEIGTLVKKADFTSVDGVIFDFGVSSHQLARPARGFSFNADAQLDMRMDQEGQKITAADLVNTLSEHDLAKIFQNFGQEHWADQLAGAICRARRLAPIKTTGQLARIIIGVRHRSSAQRIHPATKVFQALRIAVNWELESIEKALDQVPGLLAKGGVLVTISFHSLEERLVKDFLKKELVTMRSINKKPLSPSRTEILANPRSHSAKMRVAERI